MADRDEGKTPRGREKRGRAPKTSQAEGQRETPSDAPELPAGPPAPADGKTAGPPRKPVQVIQYGKGFWVFCDDGSVCVARYKNDELRWWELEPPLPGSPADRLRELPADVEELT